MENNGSKNKEASFSRTLYKGFITLTEKLISSSTGQNGLYPYYTVQTKPCSVVVIAQDNFGRFLLTHEYRHAVEKTVYSIPGGFIEENETSIEAAIRELYEETGYSPTLSSQVFLLGTCFPLPGLLKQQMSVVYISQLLPDCKPSTCVHDEYERIENIEWISQDDVYKKISQTANTTMQFDAMALAAFSMYLSAQFIMKDIK